MFFLSFLLYLVTINNQIQIYRGALIIHSLKIWHNEESFHWVLDNKVSDNMISIIR